MKLATCANFRFSRLPDQVPVAKKVLATGLWQNQAANWEEFQRGYEVLFERTYGPLRAAVTGARVFQRWDARRPTMRILIVRKSKRGPVRRDEAATLQAPKGASES